MEDVADNVPETVEEVETPVDDKPVRMSDEAFIAKDHDAEEVSDEPEETPEKDQEKPEEVEEEKDETVEKAPLTAKAVVAKIRAADPQFFKKNPEVRELIFKASQYDEYFSHPDEAKAVVDSYQAFEKLATGIMNGRADELLNNIAVTDRSGIERFAKNFPEALYKVDKSVFYDSLAHPILVSALQEVLESAAKNGDANLRNSVAHLSKALFDSPNLPSIKRNAPPDPEKQQLQNRLHEGTKARYEEAKGEISGVARNVLHTQIMKGLPKDGNAKLNEAYVNEVMDTLEGALGDDENHLRRMNGLWDRLISSGFDPRVKKQIFDAWATRAKLLLPQIEAQVKPTYFGKEIKKVTPKPQIPQGGTPKSSGRVDSSKIDYSRTSDMDILNRTPTLKQPNKRV